MADKPLAVGLSNPAVQPSRESARTRFSWRGPGPPSARRAFLAKMLIPSPVWWFFADNGFLSVVLQIVFGVFLSFSSCIRLYVVLNLVSLCFPVFPVHAVCVFVSLSSTFGPLLYRNGSDPLCVKHMVFKLSTSGLVTEPSNRSTLSDCHWHTISSIGAGTLAHSVAPTLVSYIQPNPVAALGHVRRTGASVVILNKLRRALCLQSLASTVQRPPSQLLLKASSQSLCFVHTSLVSNVDVLSLFLSLLACRVVCNAVGTCSAPLSRLCCCACRLFSPLLWVLSPSLPCCGVDLISLRGLAPLAATRDTGSRPGVVSSSPREGCRVESPCQAPSPSLPSCGGGLTSPQGLTPLAATWDTRSRPGVKPSSPRAPSLERRAESPFRDRVLLLLEQVFVCILCTLLEKNNCVLYAPPLLHVMYVGMVVRQDCFPLSLISKNLTGTFPKVFLPVS